MGRTAVVVILGGADRGRHRWRLDLSLAQLGTNGPDRWLCSRKVEVGFGGREKPIRGWVEPSRHRGMLESFPRWPHAIASTIRSGVARKAERHN